VKDVACLHFKVCF